jgi:hypothetical protein
VESEDHPGAFGEKVATVACNLAELGERRVNVEGSVALSDPK